MLRASPAVHILATSREPLRAEGESVYLVNPLSVPPDDDEDVDALSRYGAVRLFFHRARAADRDFAPDRQVVPVVAAICRRIDGIPLAIELAASRVVTLGVEEIAARLKDRFRLLAGGRRDGVAAAPGAAGDARLEL